MTGTLWTLGEAMAVARSGHALRLGGSLDLSVAGAESNVAIGIARLGHPAHWVSRVGDDELGALVLRTLRAEGVQVSAPTDADHPTGLMLVDRAPGGVTRVHYYRRGSAFTTISPHLPDTTAPSAGDVVHLTGINPALGDRPSAAAWSLLSAARDAGALVSFDVNYRARLWPRDSARGALLPYADSADLVIASDDELDLVATGDGEHERVVDLHRRGVRQVVIKRGAAGASVVTPDDRIDRPALPVTAVDPVGAGDAFTAGYLSAVLDDEDLECRLNRAVAMGACAVAALGDWEGLPTRAELAHVDTPEGTTLR